MSFFYFFSLLFELFIYYSKQPTDFFIKTSVLIAFTNIITYLITYRKSHINNYFTHSFIFIISYCITHYQKTIDYLLGVILFDTNSFITEAILNKAIALSTIGIIMFLWGYYISKSYKFKSSHKLTKKNLIQYKISTKYLSYVLAILIVLLFVSTNKSYLSGGYGVAEKGDAGFVQFLINFVIPAIIIITMYNNKNINIKSIASYLKLFSFIFWPSFILYLVWVFLSGDRGPIMINLLFFASGFFYLTEKRVNLTYFLLILFISASFISILGASRQYSRDISYIDRIKLATNNNIIEKYNTVSPITYELSSSIRCLTLSIKYIENTEGNFNMGLYQLQYLTMWIPGISTLRDQLDKSYQEQGSRKNFTSADFITYLDQGYDTKSGLGTTCTADFYLDLGLIGVIVGMFFFGFFTYYFEFIFASKNVTLFQLIISSVFLAHSYYIPRGVILTYLRFSIVIFIIIILYRYIMSYEKNKTRIKI